MTTQLNTNQSKLTKATKAESAAGTDDAKFLTALSVAELWKLPEGTLYNGKIAPSVASNNLTLAIKGMDGNDPSATNPVYCRINGVIRSITSALSRTVNAGANTFNAGSAELATKEIDYFVYLGYNATDGVVIGFSRIPYACSYDDFSTTATNEKYCAISTITNASATDYYNVIGRFAATLSAGAGYTWSVPTFTAKNLIQKPIYETRWLNYAPVLTSGADLSGFDLAKYQLRLKNCKVFFDAENKSVTSGGAISISPPMTILNVFHSPLNCAVASGGTFVNAPITEMAATTNTFDLYKNIAAVWLGNETGVYIRFNCEYEI
jgi:hypothetical protein